MTARCENVEDTIEGLAEQIRACTKCPLHKARNNAVPGTGNPNAKIMLIGEGPGENEDKQGRPFVGGSGKYLDQLLRKSGLERRDLFVTNVVKCRPPENRKPTPAEKSQCRDWLERQLEAIKPKIVVTMGAPAMEHFKPSERLTEARAKPMHAEDRDFLILPLYHPAAAIHQERFREPIEKEFPRIKEWIDILDATEEPAVPVSGPEPEAEMDNGDQDRASPKRRPQPPVPQSPEPARGALIETARVIASEISEMDRAHRKGEERDPRATRHALAVLSTAFQTTRRVARSLPEGSYREWVTYHLLKAQQIGADLGQEVPLACEECGTAFHCTTEEFDAERWCPDCRER